jgi:hypothetical protein
LVRFGDSRGVDALRYVKAIAAAAAAMGNVKYDRQDLIPEVTRATSEAMSQYENEFAKNPSLFCKSWGDALIKAGAVKRK